MRGRRETRDKRDNDIHHSRETALLFDFSRCIFNLVAVAICQACTAQYSTVQYITITTSAAELFYSDPFQIPLGVCQGSGDTDSTHPRSVRRWGLSSRSFLFRESDHPLR